MKNVFLDANIWLSLYHFTKDNFEKFEELKNLLKDEINLIVSEQVCHEVLRNRDGKVKSAWDLFCNFNFQIPAFCQCYPEYNDFQKKLKLLKEKHNKWKEAIEKDIKEHTLEADKIISDLFMVADKKNSSPEIIKKAELRYKTGNPPGKNNSLGDAINWELLLQVVPNGEDLFFISADRDYRSKFDDVSFNYYLSQEWNRKKESNIFFFTTLYDFLEDHAKTLKPKNSSSKSAGNKNNKDIKQLQKLITQFSESIKEPEKAALAEYHKNKYKEFLARCYMDENLSRINAFKNSISFNKDQFNYINKLIGNEQSEDKDKKDED